MFPRVTIPRITLGSRGQGQGSGRAPLPSPGQNMPTAALRVRGCPSAKWANPLRIQPVRAGPLGGRDSANQWVPWMLPF